MLRGPKPSRSPLGLLDVSSEASREPDRSIWRSSDLSRLSGGTLHPPPGSGVVAMYRPRERTQFRQCVRTRSFHSQKPSESAMRCFCRSWCFDERETPFMREADRGHGERTRPGSLRSAIASRRWRNITGSSMAASDRCATGWTDIGRTAIPVRVDIGFGDAVTSVAQELEFPSLLSAEGPRPRADPIGVWELMFLARTARRPSSIWRC